MYIRVRERCPIRNSSSASTHTAGAGRIQSLSTEAIERQDGMAEAGSAQRSMRVRMYFNLIQAKTHVSEFAIAGGISLQG